jgi:hypothetical protein
MMRTPSSKEQEILNYLMEEAGINSQASTLMVETMDDGGMGSLKIGNEHSERAFGKMVSEYQSVDLDGVTFIASLYLDTNGKLYEMDVWKVDNSPTKVLYENS